MVAAATAAVGRVRLLSVGSRNLHRTVPGRIHISDFRQHILTSQGDFGPRFLPLLFPGEALRYLVAAEKSAVYGGAVEASGPIGSIGAMAELVRIRQKLASRNEQDVIDLRFLDYYFGATAYIVNRRSIQKLLSIVKKAPMDEPYDIFLRRMIHERKINAFATVPFLTFVI